MDCRTGLYLSSVVAVSEFCHGTLDSGGDRGLKCSFLAARFRCMPTSQSVLQSTSGCRAKLSDRPFDRTSERIIRFGNIKYVSRKGKERQGYENGVQRMGRRDFRDLVRGVEGVQRGGHRWLPRLCTEAARQGQEWQEYESAVQSKDLTRVLEVLNTFDESDSSNFPAELVSSGDDQKWSRPFTGRQGPDYLRILDACQKTSDLMQVGKAYDWLEARGALPSFGKFKSSAAGGERLITEAVMMESSGLKASKLSPKKWGISGDSAIIFPVAIALFSWLVNNGVELRPVAAAILGLGIYDSINWGGTGVSQLLSMWLPYRERVLVHEAGHVVVAYLLGCPIRGVILTPGQAMKAGIQGQAGTQFWDKTLDMELSQNRLTGVTIDRYSIVLFAGIAAEALVFGDAEGGESDENLFKSVVSKLQPSWSPAKMSNQARWAVLQAFQLLKQTRKAHTAVVDALKEDAGLGSLVRAIELALVE